MFFSVAEKLRSHLSFQAKSILRDVTGYLTFLDAVKAAKPPVISSPFWSW